MTKQYEIIRRTNGQPEFQVADASSDFDSMRRTWCRQINRMKRQGWKEDSRFFEHTSSEVRFSSSDGDRSILMLREAR